MIRLSYLIYGMFARSGRCVHRFQLLLLYYAFQFVSLLLHCSGMCLVSLISLSLPSVTSHATRDRFQSTDFQQSRFSSDCYWRTNTTVRKAHIIAFTTFVRCPHVQSIAAKRAFTVRQRIDL